MQLRSLNMIAYDREEALHYIKGELDAQGKSFYQEHIRKLRAVDIPALSFLTNCIVFPRNGEYSIPGSMSGGDLDGDTYFVCWEQSILPPETEDPVVHPFFSEIEKISTGVTKNWTQESKSTAMVELFLEQHHNKLLGNMSTEWQNTVEKYSELARAEYPRELALLIEEALDITKNGGDYKSLGYRFEDLRRCHFGISRARHRQSLLDRLRTLIPDAREQDINTRYVPDPDLTRSLKQQYPEQWDFEYGEGITQMKKFNKKLSAAITKDYADDGEEKLPWRQKSSLSHSDQVKKRFVDKYYPPFHGFLSNENISSFIRASAWYAVGYTNNKITFAWLGARYLNQIKAYETNGGRPGITIGTTKQRPEDESNGVAIFTTVASSCLLVYDWMITFSDEVELIWHSPWNAGNILFFATRYLVFVDCTLMLINLLIPDLSDELCVHILNASGYIVAVGALVAGGRYF
ncbi:hypothetical protein EW145_g4536 [Phellinidium pouzarii]|uniref:RNA-dependent RNA polymerase n=1 Tax=Phellinidium pouzarii TaxID=167371 RepID=A0A4S4L3C3_9AGAM|nr:hypothetical protein EW145_g4536 [Phellinidium pouzarii]